MQIDVVLEVEPDDPLIAIDFLLAQINLSKSRLKEVLRRGGVWRLDVNGVRNRLYRAMTDLSVGDRIEVFYSDSVLAMKPVKLECLSDHQHYSLWYKPSKMSFQGSDWTDIHSFQRNLSLRFSERRELFWLSDYPYQASGMMLVAHSRKTASQLSTQIVQSATTARFIVRYRCEVSGEWHPPQSELFPEYLTADQISLIRFDPTLKRSTLELEVAIAKFDASLGWLASIGFAVVSYIDTEEGFIDAEEAFIETEDSLFETGEPYLKTKLIGVEFECPITKASQRLSLANDG